MDFSLITMSKTSKKLKMNAEDKKLKESKVRMPWCISSDFTKDITFTDVEIQHNPAQIRKRISYWFWKPIVERMKGLSYKRLVASACVVWHQMDARHCFGTMKQAGYDLESLALCLLEAKDSKDSEPNIPKCVIHENDYIYTHRGYDRLASEIDELDEVPF